MPSAGAPTEQSVRFRVGELPALAEGFSDRPDTARGILDALVPGSTIALVPGSEFAEGKQNWLGPSGKTQIAVMLAETLWRSGAVDMLVWISATSRSAVFSGYAEAWLAATGIEPTGTAESVAARFVSWLAETDQPWLIVLDDLPNVDELDGLWPEGPAGLITSTQSTVAASRHRTRVFPVGFFSVREALGCLTDRLSVNPAQRHGAIDLIEALGREPLALAQAAAIANSTLACRDYRDYFARGGSRSGWRRARSPRPPRSPGRCPSARPRCCCPASRFASCWCSLPCSTATGSPAPSSARSQSPSTWAVLPSGSARPSTASRRGRAARHRAGRADQHQPHRGSADGPDEPGGRGRDQAGRPLAVARPGRPDGSGRTAGSMAGGRARAVDGRHPARQRRQLAGRGQRCPVGRRVPPAAAAGRAEPGPRPPGRQAVEYWRELSVRCDNKLPPEHPDALVVAAQVAGAYLAAGYGAEAVTWYQRVLAERSVDLAPGHPAIIAARVSLAGAMITAGQPADAVTVLHRAVSESEQFRGPGHPDTLAVWDELARACEAAGDVPAAIRLLTRTLTDRERLQGARDVDTMTTRDHLAAALLADGKTKQAVSGYKRVLADRAAVLGPDHPETIATKACLASAYYASGKMPSAVLFSEQTCADSKRVLGADHADTLARQASLAHLYYAVGRVGDARALLRDALARCERVLPYGDPLRQAVRQSLANIGEG